MKKILLFIVLVFLSNILVAQKTPYFSKFYDINPKMEDVGVFLDTCSGGILIGSWSRGAIYSSDILKIDQQGNKIWLKSKLNWSLFDMHVENDTIYFTSNRYDTEGKNQDILFEAISCNGDSIFSRLYGDNGEYDFYTQFKPTPSGYVFVSRSNVDVLEDKLYFFGTDKKGNIKWKKNLKNASQLSSFDNQDPVFQINKDTFLFAYNAKVKNDPDPIFLPSVSGPISKKFFTIFDTRSGEEISTNRIFTDSLNETTFLLMPISKNRYFGTNYMWGGDTTILGQKTGTATQTVFLDKNFKYISKGTRFQKKHTTHMIRFKEVEDGFIASGFNENNDTIDHIYRGGCWVAKFDKKGF